MEKKKTRPKFTLDQSKDVVKLLSRKGFIDPEIAFVLGVSKTTLNNWKKRDPDFFAALNDWKQEANERVERALFERAVGYSHPETKAQWVNDENGGRWETITMEKYYPPETGAACFWLKNRSPEEWKDRQEVAMTGIDGLAERIKESRKRVEEKTVKT